MESKAATGKASLEGVVSPLVLVVDDDVRTARMLVRMLRDDGFEVELANDGATAIGRLSRQPIPDVLLTDFRLPHADGLAVARYARSRSATMPILIMTGYPELVPQDELGTPTVVHSKPVDYAALLEDLRRAVGLDGIAPKSLRKA